MFGGKLMDTFIDKLAQKLTAQEMIKANAAADAAELQRAKSQVAQYDALLKEIRDINKVNEDSAKQVQTLTADSAKQFEAVNQLIDESLEKIKEVQKNDQTLEELEVKLAELKDSLEPLFAELTDHVHKENVKVYRNVQAVVVEETAKVSENMAGVLKSLSGKLSAVLGISIVALLAAAAGLTFQILTYLNII